MRILIAAWQQAVVAGTEAYLREIVPVLAARGHEIALVFENLASPTQVRIESDTASPIWLLSDQTSKRVLPEIQQWRPDLCFLQGFEKPQLQPLLLDRFRTVLFAHNYHGTCISGTKRFAFPVERPCDKVFGPACLAHYFLRKCGGSNPVTMLRHYSAERLRFSLLPKYRAVLVASQAMHAEYARHGVEAERLHCVPLFPTSASPSVDPPRPHSRTGTILMLGRLTRTKGGHLAIKAVSQLARESRLPIKLVVAGDGPDLPRLERLASRLHAPVEFTGWVDAERRNQLLQQTDVLLVPSVWPEPFGLVGLEAACFGVPAVGFAMGGITDWLIPGVSGELATADPPTIQGLVDALGRVLADESRYQELRHGAWRTAQGFPLAEHVDRLEVIFENILKVDASRREVVCE